MSRFRNFAPLFNGQRAFSGYSKHSILGSVRSRRYCLASKSPPIRSVIDLFLSENREEKESFSDMTDVHVVEDAETGEETGRNLTDILTEGFMESFVPGLENLEGRLGELTQNQGILIETIQQENAKYAECQSAKSLLVMLSYVRTYHSKLTKIRQDMNSIEDRVARLQRRAMKLKLQKEKEERSKAEAQERQLELERQLTAKLASEHQQ